VEKIPITVTIVTLNEEKNISRCIGSVPFAAEVVVVDSFSQDKTCDIAKSLGAKVYQEKWRGFGAQKALAVEKSQHDWILSLDADETVSPELAQKIVSDFSNLNPETGYLLPRRSFYLGRWINHGGWYPDYQKRLFHRQHSSWDGADIHEKVRSPKEIRWDVDLHHYVFENIHEQVQTNNRYSGLLAEKLNSEGKRFSILKLIVKPGTKFLETYFWKLGVLDGLPGFIISVGAAYSVFMKWAKLWELQRKKS
jgi:glycosyltransferase involved in cell wall biosynthesis